jgi:hypothetical protein
MVDLSAMTCQVMLGQAPTRPVSFDSVATDTADLPRLLAALPPMEMLQPLAATPRPVVFAACDKNYFFQHVTNLAYSIHATNAGKLDLHLHLYSPDQKVLYEIDLLRERLPGLSIGVSAEYGTVPLAQVRSYYATARFVRAWQVLREYRCELCMIDADAMFNAGWDTFKERLAPQAELVLATPGAAPFWEQVIAGFIYCRPTPLGEHFLAKVSQFILRNIELGSVIWFTDQIALSATDHFEMQGNPSVQRLSPRQLVDIHFSPDALCWTVTTRKTGNPKYDAARERLKARYS